MVKAMIGTSGWGYPDFSERFYPKELGKTRQLAYYADFFPSVEINTTFYHLPKQSSVEHWFAQVPPNFIFSVKASRFITHLKNLQSPEETLPKFYDRISYLGEKCGLILYQFPPNWGLNLTRLNHFIPYLSEDYRHTIEFRNKTWLTDDVYALLKKRNIAFCIYDINFYQSPILTTADFVYIRLHGPGQPYRDPYDLKHLCFWRDQIRHWVAEGKDVYCYFDNTNRGHAWENAQILLSMVQGFS